MDLPGPELAAPIGVNNAARDITIAAGDCHLDRCDDQSGLMRKSMAQPTIRFEYTS